MLGPLGLACSTYYGPSLLNQFTSILLPIDYGPALHKLSAPSYIVLLDEPSYSVLRDYAI